MPRMIREGWLDSFVIDQLDASAERFFLRLCLKADDFGRFHAHPKLLKPNLFPLKDSIRETDISRDLAACEAAGLLRCYESAGNRYLVILKFGQKLKVKKEKFPPPELELELEEEGNRREGKPIQANEAKAREPSSPPTQNEVSRPNDDEVKFYASQIGLAEWKAIDWLDEMRSVGWKDYNHRDVINWKAMLTRVCRKWEADGRPMSPPSSQRNQGAKGNEKPGKSKQFVENIKPKLI